MLDWPRGEVLEVRRGGAEVLEVMLADAATLGLSGALVLRGSEGASSVLALSSGAPIGALHDAEGDLRRGEEALGPLRELLRSGATEVEVHHLPGSLVQEALAMHEGSRFAHGVEHEDVRWWRVVSLHHGDHALHGCPPWRPRCVRPKRCATPSIVPAPGSTLRASILHQGAFAWCMPIRSKPW